MRSSSLGGYQQPYESSLGYRPYPGDRVGKSSLDQLGQADAIANERDASLHMPAVM
jgi:hypothetical protein